MPLPTRPDLVLIDGSSYLYRAFFALPPLTNSSGQPTGAVHGVLSMLLKFLRDFEPPHIAVVFDAPGKTFRDELFAEYKANRPPMPDDLRAQTEPLLEAVEGLGLPLLRIGGVEADDVIGTLAVRAARAGQQVLISTGDKDMAQLVNDHITLVNTMSNSVLDRAGVKAKFDVYPEQIIDYLALVGDSSDNIPGIDKVGPKTAAKWLNRFGTLDALLAHADEIEGKVGDNLRAGLTTLALSRQLATISCDLELPLEASGLVRRAADVERLRALYRRLELRSLLQQLETSSAVTAVTAAAPVTAPADALATAAAADAASAPTAAAPPLSPGLVPASSAPSHPPLPQPTDPEAAALASLPRHLPHHHWTGRRCSAGSTGSRPRICLHSIPRPPVSTTCAPRSSACRSASSPGRRPTCRWHMTTPARRRSSIAAGARGAAAAARRPRSAARSGQHLKFDIHVLENYGIACSGQRFDTMLESYVLNSTATRHDMDSMASAPAGRAHHSFRGCRRQGRQADRLQPGQRRARPPNTRPRTPT
jgi:DNA polymerase-1